MKIGVIVFSQTGNTRSVAEKILEAFADTGHEVKLESVETISDNPPIRLKTTPDVSPYDALIFASPVQAMSLAAAMKAYLAQISGLEGKKVNCFVTENFKNPIMGGNRAVRWIRDACKNKGANVVHRGIVHWSDEKREAQIKEVVRRMCCV